MSQEDLFTLLTESRNWNKEHGITGLLVYIQGKFKDHTEGRFIQVLEGTKDETETLFHKRISLDKRHDKVTLLNQGDIEARNFSDWQMGFESIDLVEEQELKEFFNLNENILKLSAFHESNVLIDFLKDFPVLQNY